MRGIQKYIHDMDALSDEYETMNDHYENKKLETNESYININHYVISN